VRRSAVILYEETRTRGRRRQEASRILRESFGHLQKCQALRGAPSNSLPPSLRTILKAGASILPERRGATSRVSNILVRVGFRRPRHVQYAVLIARKPPTRARDQLTTTRVSSTRVIHIAAALASKVAQFELAFVAWELGGLSRRLNEIHRRRAGGLRTFPRAIPNIPSCFSNAFSRCQARHRCAARASASASIVVGSERWQVDRTRRLRPRVTTSDIAAGAETVAEHISSNLEAQLGPCTRPVKGAFQPPTAV
jgi:hypothetical protein